jgi:hypothetical protein
MTSRGGQNREKCAGCSEEHSNILAGIICSCYNQQRWAKQGKNVLAVLNRATYLQLFHNRSCLKGGYNRKRM